MLKVCWLCLWCIITTHRRHLWPPFNSQRAFVHTRRITMILLLYYIEDLVRLGKLCKTITEMECKPHLSSPEKNIVTELSWTSWKCARIQLQISYEPFEMTRISESITHKIWSEPHLRHNY